jgi:hypothetical protein
MLTRDAILDLARELDRAHVRYLIVGGVAVVAHGYVRLTTDLDLVLDLETENIRLALFCFVTLGYRPRENVAISDFKDPSKRQMWKDQLGKLTFTLGKDSPIGPVAIDLFLFAPFPFEEAWNDAAWQSYPEGIRFPCVDLGRLLAMKRASSRPKDSLDVDELCKIHGIKR